MIVNNEVEKKKKVAILNKGTVLKLDQQIGERSL